MEGILFKPDLIKAITEGRKTVTRRLQGFNDVNFVGLDGADQPTNPDQYRLMGFDSKGVDFVRHAVTTGDGFNIGVVYHCPAPRYLPGETVYIKEAHYAYGVWAFEGTWDDPTPLTQRKWRFIREKDEILFEEPQGFIGHHKRDGRAWYLRSPMFMFKKDARHFIKIKDVRPERLQEVTDEEALKEGCKPLLQGNGGQVSSARSEYVYLWDSINPKQKFETSPWVWRIEFILLPGGER